MMTVGVPNETILDGPHVNWRHIDGPLLSWVGCLHWLTWGERVRLALKLTTIEEIAEWRWPGLAKLRRELRAKAEEEDNG